MRKPDIFAQGDQPESPDEGVGANNSALAKFAVGGSAFAGAGFIKTSRGRVWDNYLDTIRAVESGSPGGILKTFRTSEFYSSLESWSHLSVSAPELGVAGEYKDYLASVFGGSKSLKMTRIGTIFGEVRDETGKLRGYGLNMELGGAKGSSIGDYYARLRGQKISSLSDSILHAKYVASKSPQSYASWLEDNVAADPTFARQRAIIGAKVRDKLRLFGKDFNLSEGQSRFVAKTETVGNLLRAKSATSIGRLNILLKTPLEVPVIGGLLHKIPGITKMAVEPGTALAMARRFTTKALLVGGAWHGLNYLDYLRSENSAWSPALNTMTGAVAGSLIAKQLGQKFSKSGLVAGAAIGLFTAVAPRFDKGLFHGAASIFTDAQVAGTQVADTVGLTGSIKRQQEVTPGLLNVTTAAGFAGIGGLAAGMYDYAGLVKDVAGRRFSGGKLGTLFDEARKARSGQFAENIWQSRAGKSARKIIPGLQWLSKTRVGKSAAGLGMIAGLAAYQTVASGLSALSGNFMAAIPGLGLLGSDQSAEELQDVYSGRKEVAVRAGRFWEFGRSSPYAGGRVQYYRPHAMARLESRADERGMWGSEEEKWAHDPLLHPISALFGSDEWKYYYEQKYQYDRPAPLSSTYGENIPFIGPVVAATVGNLIKPRKEIRSDEWNMGGGNYLYHPGVRPEEEPAYGIGGLGPGAPVSPEDPSQLLNKLNYRRREAIGLVGYAEQLRTEAMLGREELLDNQQTIATMGKETGSEYWLWKHLNMGGGAGTTEAVRRFIPRTPSYLETYNPLRNNLPSWMPEDYFLDLKYGNPFCLTKNTYVELDNLQFIKADEIQQNDVLISAHGENTIVEKTIEYKDKKVLKISLSKNSAFPIECSCEHPFAIRKLVKGRKRSARVEIYKHSNKILKEIENGGKRIDIAKRANVRLSTAASCWKILEEHKKIKLHRKGKRGTVEIINSEPFDENLLDKGIIFIEAKDLSIGDYVAYPIPKRDISINKIDVSQYGNWSAVTENYVYYVRSQESAEYLEYSLKETNKKPTKEVAKKYSRNRSRDISNGKFERFKRYISLDYDFGLFVGLWCAEGWTTGTSHNIKEEEIIKKIYDSIGINYKWRPIKDTNGASVTFCSKALGLVLSSLCGLGARNKKLNDVFWHAPDIFIDGFLEGLFFGDGSEFVTTGNRKRKSLKTSSKILTLQVKKLLLSKGIVSSIIEEDESSSVYEKTNQIITRGKSYQVNIFNEGENSFKCCWFKDEKFYYFRINKIEEIKNDTVYGWETESSTFCVAGAATHNSKIPEAEIRLPGPGYSSLNPEMEGVNPEDYSLAHKVKILGDVAMYSAEYKSYLSMAKRNIGNMSSEEVRLVRQTEEQVREKKKRRTFQEYTFDANQLESEDVTVTDVLSPGRVLTKEYGNMVVDFKGVGSSVDAGSTERAKELLVGRTVRLYTPAIEGRKYDMVTSGPRMKAVPMIDGMDIGSIYEEAGIAKSAALEDEFKQLRFSGNEQIAGKISETILHGMESPMDYLTPASPGAKLIRQRSAVEEYVAAEAIGTNNAFWNKPVEHFLRPAANMAAYKMGDTEIPEGVQERRDITEYFDMLKWEKYRRIEDEARGSGDMTTAASARQQKGQTVFGVDAYRNPTNILKALPRRERDFFNEFAGATTEEERAQILQLVPENEKRIYAAQWFNQAARAAQAKQAAGIATEEDNNTLNIAQMVRATEGFPYQEGMEEQWAKETNGNVALDEWIRNKKAEEYFSSHSLPGADWIGWCVLPDQEILTSDSRLVLANDVKLGQSLTTLQGENKVEQIFKRETIEEITTIKVHHNSVYQMAATNNHLILAIETQKCKYNLKPESVCTHMTTMWKCNFCTTRHYESYSAKWIPIKDATTDMYLPVPLLKHSEEIPIFDIGLLDCFPDNTIVDTDTLYPSSGIRKPIKRHIVMDEATCWLIGYYLAEGNVWAVKDRMRGVQFTSHINEVSILELAQKIIKDRFGLDSVIRFKKNENSESAYLVVASGLFGWLINYWVGRFCDKKFAPIWLEDITYKCQVAILDGLNTGDATKDEITHLALANKELCYMAKRIYETQGIPASLHGPHKRNGKDQYSTRPLKSSLAAIIGDNFIAYRIEKIEKSEYKGPVFDFEVKDEHVYCSPIGIYHNSPAVDLEDVKLQYVEQAGCVSKETILFTKDIKTIKAKELKEGYKIMNSNSDITEIKKVFRNKNNGETYKLSNSGSFEAEMIITGNHVVPVLRPTNSEYRLIEIPVREIRTKDKMLYPKLNFEETKTEIDLLDYADKNKESKIKVKYDDDSIWFLKTKKYPRKIMIDKEFGFFLGTYIAEGNLTYRNGKPKGIQLSLSLEEMGLANKIKEYLLKFNIKTNIKREKKAKALRVSIHNVLLASLILSFCDGKNATEKQLTEDFFNLPKESILASLYNWFIGDGSVDKRINGTQMPRNLTIQTSSKLLARQGWYLLNSFGIRSRLQFVKARPNKLCKNAADSYRLNIGDKIAKTAFLSIKEASQKDYFERITIDQKLEQYFWFGVSIEPIVCDEEILYDFDMGDPHFYTTSCGIIHNSDYHDFDLWGQRERALARKPYINPTMISEMQEQAEYDPVGVAANNARKLASLYGGRKASVIMSKIDGGRQRDTYNVEIRDGRKDLVSKAYSQLGA